MNKNYLFNLRIIVNNLFRIYILIFFNFLLIFFNNFYHILFLKLINYLIKLVFFSDFIKINLMELFITF